MLQARLLGLGIAGVAILGALAWGGQLLYRAGYNASTVEHVKDAELIKRAARAAEVAAAQAIQAIEIKHVTIRQNLEKELTRDVVYRDCIASDRVLELTNQTLTGGTDTSSDRLLPAAEPAQ